jgi:N-acetylglucosaminyl-diphospho-decaprenol L-rhamnosyltransferase
LLNAATCGSVSLLSCVAPSLDIIIVNWNTGLLLQACLRSIAACDRSSFHIGRVVVVDNASVDGSCDNLDDSSLPLVLSRNTANRGFAAACNQGAVGTASDYLLFLNPDTALFKDSLARPIAFMEEPANADAGICGVRLVADDGATTVSCARFPTLGTFVGQATGLTYLWPRVFKPHLMTADECRFTRDVDQIIGAFFLMRRSVFTLLGGFDDRFFVYFEEVDLSLRARQHGYRSVYLADAAIYHRGGVSSEQVKATRLFYSLRSRLLFGFKHFGRLNAMLLVVITVVIEPLTRLGRAFARGSLVEARETLQGYIELFAYLGQRSRSPMGER